MTTSTADSAWRPPIGACLIEGLEFYAMLAARGKTTRMVEYPGSPHFPVLWEQRIDIFREIAEWLKRYNP